MKLSFRALLEWVDFQGTANDAAKILADLGFPNDGIEHRGEGLDQVVVGKVLEKNKHPQADRLNLLLVDVGAQKLPIVCGAQNMAVGDYVALAPVGAKVPGKDGAGLVIKEAKIRGEISKGMCCSEAELNLSKESEGILLLSKDKVKDSDLGKKVGELLSLEDWILLIDVTPNRPDAMSVRGLARELAAKAGLKLKSPSLLKWKNPTAGVNPSIENFSDASAFAACLVQGVQVKPTPVAWQKFLEVFGSRSISNLVDITNIVVFELGHPIHFFDADKVDCSTITVRRARGGESLVLLDGKKIDLHPEDLVIADASGPLSLAGIMGGRDSGVSDATKNVLIEVACFNPSLIRASAKRHGISSEASARFERGLTPTRVDEVLERSLWLLKELSGFEVASGTKTIDRQFAPKTVLWDRKRIEQKLGILKLSDNDIFEILRRLEYSFQPKGSTTLVCFPWYRVDVQFLEDAMEDIARLIGYESLERKSLVGTESVTPANAIERFYSVGERLVDAFVSHGYSDVIHMSFENPEFERRCEFSNGTPVVLKNPIYADRPILRRSLLPGLFASAQKNFFHGEEDIRLVEWGPVFSKTAVHSKFESLYAESPVLEEWRIACLWLPRASDKKSLWKNSVDPFYEFKGQVESLISEVRWGAPLAESEISSALFHPKRWNRFSRGAAGEVHPQVMRAWDLPGRAFVGEWRLAVSSQWASVRYSRPMEFPGVELDASFLINSSISVQDVMNCFRKVKTDYLEAVAIYDIFESKDLGDRKKSMTFAMRYRAVDKTLTSEEAKVEHEKLVSAALNAFREQGIALR